ncbi:unnamed protein product [Spodoptera exigua]|nr:unnamed protein product [Spodoptera exigua]
MVSNQRHQKTKQVIKGFGRIGSGKGDAGNLTLMAKHKDEVVSRHYDVSFRLNQPSRDEAGPYQTRKTRAILFIYSKGVATMTESIFLYLLYPVGRLVDDYTFHYGAPPTKLRILSLRMVPVYYTVKFYFLMKAVWNVLENEKYGSLVPHYMWSWSLMLIPLFIGVVVVLYQYLIKQQMTWQLMFRPMPKWGPREFSERQLRKQYSSRYYISSEVPRLLSRYLIKKRESKVYKVDVRYDVQRRHIVTKAVGFGAVNGDKKKI